MKNIIVIKEQENKGKSILHVLKTLYTDGSEIKSLNDIDVFMNKYHHDGVVNIYIEESCIDSVRFICENNNIQYLIK